MIENEYVYLANLHEGYKVFKDERYAIKHVNEAITNLIHKRDNSIRISQTSIATDNDGNIYISCMKEMCIIFKIKII